MSCKQQNILHICLKEKQLALFIFSNLQEETIVFMTKIVAQNTGFISVRSHKISILNNSVPIPQPPQHPPTASTAGGSSAYATCRLAGGCNGSAPVGTREKDLREQLGGLRWLEEGNGCPWASRTLERGRRWWLLQLAVQTQGGWHVCRRHERGEAREP